MDPDTRDASTSAPVRASATATPCAAAGIFRTTDGVDLGAGSPPPQTADFQFVNRIAVSADGEVVLAATATGIFRSADAGRARPGRRSSTCRVGDVRFDPADDHLAVAGALDAGEAGSAPTADGPGRRRRTHGAVVGPGRARLRGHGPHDRLRLGPGDARRDLAVRGRRPELPAPADPRPGGHAGALPGRPGLVRQRRSGPATRPTPTSSSSAASTCGAAPTAATTSPRSAPGGTRGSAHADHHAIVSHPALRRRRATGPSSSATTAASSRAADLAPTGTEPKPPFVNGWTELVNNYGVTQFYGGAGNTAQRQDHRWRAGQRHPLLRPGRGHRGLDDDLRRRRRLVRRRPDRPEGLLRRVRLPEHPPQHRRRHQRRHRGRPLHQRAVLEQRLRTWDWKPVPFQHPGRDDATRPCSSPRSCSTRTQPDRMLAGGLSLWRTTTRRRPTPRRPGRAGGRSNPAPDRRSARSPWRPANSDVVWVGHATAWCSAP